MREVENVQDGDILLERRELACIKERGRCFDGMLVVGEM
jgi:hypothetical protein